eukprot:TRINITY_DN16056_c0_g1_i1.p1 TRINITY_DN16056_c0_g1~~TRINITY_DN16056_c0_g1_i1.p1  ORF type:complete len:326 (+),score=62.61 TRINITY_DN16056_c0_g1_i1:280-1257(+)
MWVKKSLVADSGSFCTDWRQPKKKLPKAKVMFLSGSQNHQTSKDLGNGGALTLYAIGDSGLGGNWGIGATDSVAEALKAVHADFRRRHLGQVPNVCSFPTFRDKSHYTPYDVQSIQENVAWDTAVGGEMPSYSYYMRAPSFCTHGYKDADLNSHKRTKEPKRNGILHIDERLNSAKTSRDSLPLEGWFEATKEVLPENETPATPTKLGDRQSSWSNSLSRLTRGVSGLLGHYLKQNPGVDELLVEPALCANKRDMCSGFRAREDGTVTSIREGKPAWKAGLQKDDVIKHIRSETSETKQFWAKLSSSAREQAMKGPYVLYVTRKK